MSTRRNFLKLGAASTAVSLGIRVDSTRADAFDGTADWLADLDAVAQSDLVRRRLLTSTALASLARARLARFARTLPQSCQTRFTAVAPESGSARSTGVLQGAPTIDSESAYVPTGVAGMTVVGRCSTASSPHLISVNPDCGAVMAVAAKVVPALMLTDGYSARVRQAASASKVPVFLPSTSHGSVVDSTRLTTPDCNRTAWLSHSIRDLMALRYDACCAARGIQGSWSELRSRLDLAAHERPLRFGLFHSLPGESVASDPSTVAVLDDARFLADLGHIVEYACPDQIVSAEFEELVVQLWAAESRGAQRNTEGRRIHAEQATHDTLHDHLLQRARKHTGASYWDLRMRVRAYADALLRWWQHYDVLMLPGSVPAPRTPGGRLSAHVRLHGLAMLTGQPVLSLPARAVSPGVSASTQFIANLGSDVLLLNLARSIESAHPRARPPSV